MDINGWQRLARLDVAVEIDHIIEIARPGALDERPYLLAEGFLVGVGGDVNAVSGRVTVWMEDG